MSSRLRHALATGQGPWARRARAMRRGILRGAIPWPRLLVVPYRLVYVGIRGLVHWFRRVFVAEPIFRSYCTSIGRGFHTDIYVHWVQGAGRIVIGDDVLIDGKCSFTFTNRYDKSPILSIGSRCYIGHDCRFVVARSIEIGNDVRLATGVTLREASGHPLNPARRAAGEAAPPESVKPIRIEDGAWLGADATILGGVTVGHGSVVATCAVVTRDVPPGVVVAGNPARVVREGIESGTA